MTVWEVEYPAWQLQVFMETSKTVLLTEAMDFWHHVHGTRQRLGTLIRSGAPCWRYHA